MSEPTNNDPTPETQPTPKPAEELTDDQLNSVAGGALPSNFTQENLAKSLPVLKRAVVSSVGGTPEVE